MSQRYQKQNCVNGYRDIQLISREQNKIRNHFSDCGRNSNSFRNFLHNLPGTVWRNLGDFLVYFFLKNVYNETKFGHRAWIGGLEMIAKYRFGKPIETEAAAERIEEKKGKLPVGNVETGTGFCFSYSLEEEDIIYGLGEANRGINKRGYQYISDCTDDPNHTESRRSLYAAHNFIVIAGKESVGLFFDYPSVLTFDIGYTKADTLTVSCGDANLDVYVITGENPYEIIKEFRKLIGRSYIPPKFAFGYGQSRWGYETEDDFREVADKHRENGIPLDMIYMDIDYMERFKDFTVDREKFKDFPAFVEEMKQKKIQLIPIIDAGVKVEKGYEVYEEGVRNHYFCKREDGSDFVAAVWPGDTHFPDVLNEDARKWFGDQYRFLTEQGIEGFWNDMNEPAIFYSAEGLKEARQLAEEFVQDESAEVGKLTAKLEHLANNHEDYERFYHFFHGEKVRHDRVHNLFGYYMTRAASEAFERIDPNKRFLMFSRSSYIGMHRYGGIWTGDNHSWWFHLLLNLKMMPSLNMCGFLYTGADLGGFGGDTTRELMLRWLAFGVFTPLMRNHSAKGTRKQEFYQFERTEDFRSIIQVRYRLIPYLYSEYMKAALNDEMYFRPLAFVYPQDKIAVETEDQLMLGNEIMIAPVYQQNAKGRYVYLPEEMMRICFREDGSIREEILGQGIHYVEMPLNTVTCFIRKGKMIPVAETARCVEEINTENMQMLGYPGAVYSFYEDDGIHKDYENPENYRELKKEL